MNHWGLAGGQLDLLTGELTDPWVEIIEPLDLTGKQVRQNSKDLHHGAQIAKRVLARSRAANVVFVEMPVGSQSARAMASYGLCVGICSAIEAEGIPLIQVMATASKMVFTGDPNATKRIMINKAVELYPNCDWPKGKKEPVGDKAEHAADAFAAIHSGVQTAEFQTLMRLYQQVNS